MIAVIAQVATEWWAPLSQLGLAGAMLYWFTSRAESRMKAMEESIRLMPEGFRDSMRSLEESVDRMAKAALIQVISFEQHETNLKAQAKALLVDLESKSGNH